MPYKNTSHKQCINSAIHNVEWPARNVLAFTTTRKNPFPDKSSNIQINNFSDFNVGDHVGDNPQNVLTHRNQLLDLLPIHSQIQWFEQVHGNHVEIIECIKDKKIIADAAITRQKNITLAIMTADCLPILLSSITGDEVAAIHGGWRPLAQGIISETVNKMQAQPNHLVAWLGPCIGLSAFEVGEEVKQAFVEISPEFARAFVLKEMLKNATDLQPASNNNKYHADLSLIAQLQLNLLGIKTISRLPHCTYSRSQEYYSYRRENKTGRMASLICRI